MGYDLTTLAGRLKDAMDACAVSPSQLAQACEVSAAAVTLWRNGDTRRLTAANYESAARALKVRAEWLRTGKGPRDREARDLQTEQFQDAVKGLREPLAALMAAIEAIAPLAEERRKRR